MPSFQKVKVLESKTDLSVNFDEYAATYSIPAGHNDTNLRAQIRTLAPVAKKALGLDVQTYGVSLHKGGQVIINCRYETPDDGSTTINTPRLQPEKYDFDMTPIIDAALSLVTAVNRKSNQVSIFENGDSELTDYEEPA